MIKVKEWFLNKEFTTTEKQDYNMGLFTQTAETEKAICITFEFGKNKWVPKSCLMTEEEVNAAIEKFDNRFNRYEKLLAFAKENGLAVRARMKAATILEKIKAAGLEYAY